MSVPVAFAPGYSPAVAAPDLQVVADVYNDAARTGHAPTLAVEQRFGVSRSTAGRWVRAARNAGLLEPVGWGASPRLNRKVVAVAREMGVDPGALQAAILRQGGDLRIH
jgi:hypothetical protein